MTITPYALPAFSNFMDLFPFLNTLTGGLFGYFTVAGIWVLLYSGGINSGKDKTDALLQSGFVTTLATGLLWTIGAVNPIAVAPPAILTGLAFFLKRRD